MKKSDNIMKNKDIFHKHVYELVSELKIPLIDENVHNKVKN